MTTALTDHPDFRRLWLGQAASKLGSRGSVVSVPLLVLAVTHSPALMACVAIVEAVTDLVVMVPGGVLADRYDRRTIMVGCDLGCALAVGTLALAVATHRAGLAVIIGVCVVDCLLGSLFTAASGAALPRLVPGEQLGSAIALIQARNSVVYMVAPLLGGFLFGLGHPLPFALDCLSYLCSCSLLLRMRTRLDVQPGSNPSFLSDAGTGLRFVLHHPFLRYAIVSAAALNAVFSGVLVAAIGVSDQGGQSGATIGAIVTSAGIGSVAGSLLTPVLRRRLSGPTIVVATLVTMVALVPLMGSARSPVLLGALIAACAVLAPAMSAVIMTQLTLSTPDALQGRVQSAVCFASMCATPVGPLLAGAVLQAWGGQAAYLAMDAVLALVLLGSVHGMTSWRARPPGSSAPPGPPLSAPDLSSPTTRPTS